MRFPRTLFWAEHTFLGWTHLFQVVKLRFCQIILKVVPHTPHDLTIWCEKRRRGIKITSQSLKSKWDQEREEGWPWPRKGCRLPQASSLPQTDLDGLLWPASNPANLPRPHKQPIFSSSLLLSDCFDPSKGFHMSSLPPKQTRKKI